MRRLGVMSLLRSPENRLEIFAPSCAENRALSQPAQNTDKSRVVQKRDMPRKCDKKKGRCSNQAKGSDSDDPSHRRNVRGSGRAKKGGDKKGKNKEATRMKFSSSRFRQAGYSVRVIPSDGNCLYTAFADQLGVAQSVKELRDSVVGDLLVAFTI
eukprot:GHVU01049566.1.p1 GENE.GHVU01049566.1~~GHVU01049566.1.p1  ORF type:complete len:155 (+),score=7.66 GHVU01049566.1:233-697(+)